MASHTLKEIIPENNSSFPELTWYKLQSYGESMEDDEMYTFISLVEKEWNLTRGVIRKYVNKLYKQGYDVPMVILNGKLKKMISFTLLKMYLQSTRSDNGKRLRNQHLIEKEEYDDKKMLKKLPLPIQELFNDEVRKKENDDLKDIYLEGFLNGLFAAVAWSSQEKITSKHDRNSLSEQINVNSTTSVSINILTTRKKQKVSS